MAKVTLDGERIKGWESFHSECELAFGFPEFYGRNMNAWVDCLSYLRDEDGMSKFRLEPDEILQIEVSKSGLLQQTMPEILEDLTFCVEAINERYEDYGELPALKLILL
jgi:RNAse (barnase) inhibitor barstar